MHVSELTRRDIFDAIRAQGVDWSGRLEEPDFLSRLFNLEELPSFDHRFENAAGDIWQHRINNHDWDDDWVFTDQRFNISGDDDVFLRFLCEMLHPVVRSDRQEVESLRQLFNEILSGDGFEIVERSRISNRPVFAARLRSNGAPSSLRSAQNLATSLDAEYLSQQITRLEASIPHDPALAIGTAKELVETCCKTILEEHGQSVDNDWNLGKLVKETQKVLKLVPEAIPNEAKAIDTIRRLLSNLAAVTQGLAELRNEYGTGHGKSALSKGLRQRHAKLAVGAATTLAVFLFETHQEQLLKATASRATTDS